MRSAQLAMLILALALVGQASAYSRANLNGLLASYNVTSTTINSLHAVNLTYSGHEYVALYYNTNMQFLVNVSNSSIYTLVTNTTEINTISKATIVSMALASVNLTQLESQMKSYNQSSASTIADCAYETGLSSGQYSCTLQNGCQSCFTVPVCNKAMGQTGGPTGPIGVGVMEFEGQYLNLTSGFSTFLSAVASINASNSNSEAPLITSSFASLYNLTQNIAMNPLFPPPATADYSLCSSAGQLSSNTSTSGPWYCNAVGFCGFLTYNYTLLDDMQVTVNRMKLLPLTDSQVLAVAANVSANEESYIIPTTTSKQTKVYAEILNTTLSGYGQLTNESAALLTHLSNASLLASLSTLQASYVKLKAQYTSLNLTQFNATLAAQVANLKANYTSVNATYSSVYGLARNNTALLLELQLNSNVSSEEVSALSFKEAKLNAELSGSIQNITMLKAQLLSIKSSIGSASLYTGANPFAETARDIDAPIASAMENAISLPYATKVALAPLFAAIISLIIGIIILALIFLKYRSLHAKRRIHVNPRTARNWKIVFAVALVLVVAYVIITYVAASAASSSTPVGAFRSAALSAKGIAIITNGTATQAELNCTARISTVVLAEHKKVYSASLYGNQCTYNNTIYSSDNCLNLFAEQGTPMIILKSSNVSRVSAYSFYGSILRVQGDDSFMSECVPASLVG